MPLRFSYVVCPEFDPGAPWALGGMVDDIQHQPSQGDNPHHRVVDHSVAPDGLIYLCACGAGYRFEDGEHVPTGDHH